MLAEELHRRGWPVEILTTCAVNPHSWTGDYRPGTEVVNGITVRRFPQESRKYTRKVFRTEQRILAREKVSRRRQEFWIRNVVTSLELCRYLDEHREDYRAFVFIPYLFGTSYLGVKTVPEKAYLIPCLHDEPYAYLDIFRDMMRSVRGVMFNTPPEMELARRLYGEDIPGRVVGGVAFRPYAADGNRFRYKYSISGDFVLYSGRREIAKNTPLLLRYFCNYLENGGRDVKLVLIGSGEVEIPFSFRSRVIDLGFVSERDKRDAYAAATVVCQPSTRESLSLVLLEAWLVEVPCLVHGDCAVTRHHVETSGGGLWFNDYPTFHEALDFLLDHPGVREEMGRRGRRYILENYSWERIVDNFRAVLEEGERR
jgi:glycosyltransferase involved in cell wall biosynthesis